MTNGHEKTIKRPNTLILICLLSWISSSWGIVPLHDSRYQFGPEVFKVDDGDVGIGFVSDFNGNLNIPLHIKFGMNSFLELGGRLDINLYNQHSNTHLKGDIGFKARISSYQAVQADLVFGIANSGIGTALGYTTVRKYTQKVYSFFEVRLGFFDMLKNGDGLFSIETAAYPELRLFPEFTLRLGLAAATTIGALNTIGNSLNIDMLPTAIYRAGGVEYSLEIAMGIIGPQSDSYRFALYATTGI